ncbi:UNVERIFIED_CONTAM: hypothetical protein RMT77_018367 [Armadillidium vulgare]
MEGMCKSQQKQLSIIYVSLVFLMISDALLLNSNRGRLECQTKMAQKRKVVRIPPTKRFLGVDLPDYIASQNAISDLRERMLSSGK